MPITGGGGSGGSSTLAGLTDVLITGLLGGDILQYNGVKWINIPTSGDWLSQYLYLPGRTGGQILGGGAHTGGTTFSLAIEGALLVGDAITGVNFTAGRGLDIRDSISNGGTNVVFQPDVTGLTGSASGTLTVLQVLLNGTPGYTTGTFAARGFFFVSSIQVPASVTNSESLGALFQVTPTAGSTTSIISKISGIRCTPQGPSGTIPSTAITEVVGVEALPSNRLTAATSVYGIKVDQAAAVSAAVTNFVAYEIRSTALASANVTTWSGLRIPSIAGPTNIWGLNITGTMNNQIAGKLALGQAIAPAHTLDLGAGTNTIAPIRLAAGTNLTTPVAGCEEYDGNYLYQTHGDAVRTKIVTQRGQLDLTNQNAAIGATTLYSPPLAGYYVVNYTLECTTADNVTPAVSVQFQINYTDDIGATNQTGAALSLAATGRDRGSFQIYSASGNITYQTNVVTIGTSRYALRVRLVALG